MRRALIVLPLLVASLAATGCLSPSDPGVVPTPPPIAVNASWAITALPTGEGHDHHDPAQHRGLSTPNWEIVGWNALPTEAKANASAGGWSCGESGVTKTGRHVAVVNSFTTDVMFVLVDITDPAHPMKLGEYVMPEGHAYDVAMTPDGAHVLLAQNNVRKGNLGVPGLAATSFFRNACGETVPTDPADILSTLPGVVLFNVEDPMHPKIVDGGFGGAFGPHSVATSLVDGVTYAIVSALQSQHQGSFFEFYTVDGDKLTLLSTYQAPPQKDAPPPLLNGHMDGTIARHPVTKQLLAYLADWNAGLIVVDLTIPQAPVTVSQFTETTDPTAFIDEGGAIHDVWPINGTWEGKHYVLAGQELTDKPQGRPSGWVYILDDTDPANLKVAGRWTIPVEREWQGYLAFSLHYIGMVDRTLFVSAYHAGLWAVDLSTAERIKSPTTLGVFIPDKTPPSPPNAKDQTATPDVEDVIPQPDGSLLTFDAYSGAYVLRFHPETAVPMLPAWTDAHPVK
jgi:hypothetical protein